jgi:AraC-like DNA-binding protein
VPASPPAKEVHDAIRACADSAHVLSGRLAPAAGGAALHQCGQQLRACVDDALSGGHACVQTFHACVDATLPPCMRGVATCLEDHDEPHFPYARQAAQMSQVAFADDGGLPQDAENGHMPYTTPVCGSCRLPGSGSVQSTSQILPGLCAHAGNEPNSMAMTVAEEPYTCHQDHGGPWLEGHDCMLARITTQLPGAVRPPTCAPEADPPLLSSASTAWAGLPFEVRRMSVAERFDWVTPPAGEHAMLVVLDGTVNLVLNSGGADVLLTAQKGSALFLSGDHPSVISCTGGSADAATIRLPHEWFERALLAGPPEVFGRTEPLERDDTIESLVGAMCREVAAGAPTGRLFAESLSLALVTYAVERVPPSKLRVRGGLSDEQCRRIRGYIRDRLQKELSLVELSSLVGLRPRQFSTLFRRAFGTTTHRYVISQRVAEAARMLGSGDDNLAGIALRIGFCSQSHFTAAFRQAYGVTPGRYAAEHRKKESLS